MLHLNKAFTELMNKYKSQKSGKCTLKLEKQNTYLNNFNKLKKYKENKVTIEE